MLRHRPVWLAALGLAAAVAAAPAPARGQSQKYLPADAEILATLNFRQILESELAKTQKEKVDQLKGLFELSMQNNEEARKLLEALGFDLFRDFDRVTLASAASTNPEKGLIIIEGKFDPEKFQKTAEAVAREKGEVLKIVPAGEHRIWEVTAPGQEKTLYLSLVNKSTLLASVGKGRMTEALARSPSAGEPALNAEVKELLKTTSPTQSFSFVATGKALSKLAEAAKNNPQAQAAAPVLKQVAGLSAAITVGKDIDFQVGVGTHDKEAADVLSKQAGGLILFGKGIVAQKAKEDPKAEPALEILKTLQTTVEGTTVVIRGQVAGAVLDKAIKNSQR